MSPNRRFIPLVVFGIFGAVSYVVAILKSEAGRRFAQTCEKTTCAFAQADFNDAILIALFGTMLLIAGGFISVLIGRRSTPPAPPVPPYGPPR